MVTAQQMVDNQRQNENYLSQVEYCSTPPTTENLVRMRFVIPGDHLAPKALRDPDILDDIRREHKVWITREDGSETHFDVSALGTKSLKSALAAINERIHDMRLAEESLAAHFFVQPLREKQEDLKIRFEVGKRPTIEGNKDAANCTAHAIAHLSAQFAAVLPSAFKTLVALSNGTTKAAASRCTEVQAHHAIDWIISVPDACVDWNLRVDSRPAFIGERSGKLPEEIAKFVRSFVFNTGDQHAEIDGGTRLFRLPKWQVSNRGELAQALSNFEIKSCARTQYRDTPYEIEITVTQHWARLPTRAEPDRLSWSVSVSGIHWEEALSEYNTGEALNGPEEGLFRMWPGEGSLEERLREFLVCIFSVQTAAAAFVAEEGEGTCTRGGE
ncbi:hypothetical protein NLG97_g4455 [Lecanicillium saksenae]|uniref:Uncharacterized protein n=1 Tax=Lecanicillium saksenae TaxID=468837 RepID=A0ACC1QX33_9HYPO|nr:hypothetical protein NLG97_g4455 [Lecanicillium saksenae]